MPLVPSEAKASNLCGFEANLIYIASSRSAKSYIIDRPGHKQKPGNKEVGK